MRSCILSKNTNNYVKCHSINTASSLHYLLQAETKTFRWVRFVCYFTVTCATICSDAPWTFFIICCFNARFLCYFYCSVHYCLFYYIDYLSKIPLSTEAWLFVKWFIVMHLIKNTKTDKVTISTLSVVIVSKNCATLRHISTARLCFRQSHVTTEMWIWIHFVEGHLQWKNSKTTKKI